MYYQEERVTRVSPSFEYHWGKKFIYSVTLAFGSAPVSGNSPTRIGALN